MTILQIEIEDSSQVKAHRDAQHLNVRLADGRILQTPLWWYPHLWNSAPIARNMIELLPLGLHWPELDEDISIASMLRGQKAPGAKPPAAA